MDSFDYCVIGGGSGGLGSAIRAAKHGAKVAIIEKTDMGGTCVNVGCVPKKVMWLAAEIAQQIQWGQAFGFDIGTVSHDWARLVENRTAYIKRIHASYERTLTALGITVISGTAQFVSPTEVAVGSQRIKARHFCIATGGTPIRADIDGAAHAWLSDDIFELKAPPKSLVVIGGGFIASEMASFFNGLGTQVTWLYRRERPLRQFDEATVDHLLARMAHEGITLGPTCDPSRIDKTDSGYQVTHCNGVTEGEAVLMAIGRKPNTDNLGLENAGIQTLPSGHIEIDRTTYLTSQPHIAALGDVVAPYPDLTPVAVACGRRLSDHWFAGRPLRPLNEAAIASVVFTHPTMATVGLSEAEAKAAYGSDGYQIYTSSFRAMPQALQPDPQTTFMKVITQGPDEVVVGIHLCGEQVDEMIQGFAVAVQMKATKQDLLDTMAIHPTGAEEVVTIF